MITTYEIIISLLLVILFFYGPWQWFLLDLFRQRLFVIRDSMFLLNYKDKHLNEPEYRLFRQKINSTIRFAHTISWWRMVLVSEFYDDIENNEEYEQLRTGKYKAAYKKMAQVSILFMVARSPLLMLLFVVMIPYFLISYIYDSKAPKTIQRAYKRSRHALFEDIEFSRKTNCSV